MQEKGLDMKRFEFELDGNEYAYERVLPDEGKAGAFTEYVVAEVDDEQDVKERRLYRLFVRPYNGTPADEDEVETTQTIADNSGGYIKIVAVVSLDGGDVFCVVCEMWRRMSQLTDQFTEDDLNEKGAYWGGDPPRKARARAIQAAYGEFEKKLESMQKKNITFLDVNPNAFSLDNMVRSPDGKALFMYDFSANASSAQMGDRKRTMAEFFPAKLGALNYVSDRWGTWVPRAPVYN